jgi:hypothetical protein
MAALADPLVSRAVVKMAAAAPITMGTVPGGTLASRWSAPAAAASMPQEQTRTRNLMLCDFMAI